MSGATRKNLLSVFIPTKNSLETIHYAITSILKIQRNDLELVVHDCGDGSVKGRLSLRMSMTIQLSWVTLQDL